MSKKVVWSWSEPTVFIPEGRVSPYDGLPKAYRKWRRKFLSEDVVVNGGTRRKLGTTTLSDYIYWVMSRRRDRERFSRAS